jgi:hypothetical protein
MHLSSNLPKQIGYKKRRTRATDGEANVSAWVSADGLAFSTEERKKERKKGVATLPARKVKQSKQAKGMLFFPFVSSTSQTERPVSIEIPNRETRLMAPTRFTAGLFTVRRAGTSLITINYHFQITSYFSNFNYFFLKRNFVLKYYSIIEEILVLK